MSTKADNNVPFQDRPRYNIVGVSPTTIIQKLSGALNFTGKRASTLAETDPSKIDPVVSGGKAIWEGLQESGIFFLGGSRARPLVVESYYTKNCTATMNIVSIDDPNLESTPVVLRPVPAAADGPFILGPGECISAKSTGGTAPGAEIGFVVRLEGTKIL